MRDAKFNEINREKAGFGRQDMKTQQLVLSICWFFLGIILLFGPMIPFALGNRKASPFEIDSGEIHVYVRDKRGIKLGTMFHSNINYMVSNKSINAEIHEKLNKKEMLFYKLE